MQIRYGSVFWYTSVPVLAFVVGNQRLEYTGEYMSYFGKFYLDKEKDIIVHLDMNGTVLSYTIFVHNHQSDNLIKNLAAISGQKTVVRDGQTAIVGEIPCYIKGDGQRVYISG